MHGESEGKRPGAGVQGEVARLNNGVTLNPSVLMSAAAKKKKKEKEKGSLWAETTRQENWCPPLLPFSSQAPRAQSKH